MSLVTTVHITVRQKGRYGDAYIGYLPLSPGNFKINSSPVTRSYKLGSKPGKHSSKVRGDLQISFQFLSKWSEQMDQSDEASMELVRAQAGMLQQSSCDDVKIWMANGMRTENGVGAAGERNANVSRGKKEIFSSLRKSLKRKNKPTVSKTSQDDFTSFMSGRSVPRAPRLPKRSNTLMHITHSSSAANGRLSVGQFTDSDSSVTSLPPLVTPTVATPTLVAPTRGSAIAMREGAEKLAPKKEPGRVSPASDMVNMDY